MRLVISLFFVMGVAAADLAGVWQAACTMPDGSKHESTLDLQVSGEKLTGKITSKRGTVEITEGKISGDNLSFIVIRRGNGDELKVDFTGRIEGGTMKLKMQYRDHGTVSLVARRTS
jgi:hypothetical protein